MKQSSVDRIFTSYTIPKSILLTPATKFCASVVNISRRTHGYRKKRFCKCVQRSHITGVTFTFPTSHNLKKIMKGFVRDLNPGPLTPKARIIPLDQQAHTPTNNQSALSKESYLLKT